MSAAQFKTVREQIARSAEGYPLLGYVIYWAISDINVKHADFLAKLTELGLPTEVAPAVQAKSAAIKAIMAETKNRDHAFHRKAVDDENIAGFAIVRSETVDAQNVDVEFTTDTRVILNKHDKSLKIDGANAEAIQAAYANFRETYTSDKFRNVVLKLVKNHCLGMSVRERGGVYFIPASHNEMFEKLQLLFEAYPTCSLDIVPVIDTAQAKTAMWKVFMKEITEDLSALKADVEELGPEASGKSLEVRLERFRALQDKVENYEILMNGTASDLKQELNTIAAAIRSRLE